MAHGVYIGFKIIYATRNVKNVKKIQCIHV